MTNLSNGRQLVVRINDRAPYTPGRIIDLDPRGRRLAHRQLVKKPQ